ncbi:hypothetical protein JZ751_000161 [Albula glossodonta]|uniref:Ephrin RBD domain-containing protein n=1 Tax=Albula glossodonta TaxID=121402 RepID=A0A8T2PVF8_9TELE|nr:hypothetical protein JZ751_000161 [Albula glossodonta]
MRLLTNRVTPASYWDLQQCGVRLRREGYTVQVNVNDYLDIYCPHYNDSQRGVSEQYILYMVTYRGYRTCDPQLGFKRWECNRPHAPHAPIKFSEKFQRYSAFSLGYEFNVGQDYYYISTPTHHHGHSCLRLRVYVCCATIGPSVSIRLSVFSMPSIPLLSSLMTSSHPGGSTGARVIARPKTAALLRLAGVSDEFNPEIPKLEKSISGSSPSHDRLLLTVAGLFLAALSVS